MANHSKAPWHTEYGNLIVDENMRIIARTARQDNENEEFCNGELLAAAPELLAACESALDKLSLTPFVNLYAEIESAVNKAKGA